MQKTIGIFSIKVEGLPAWDPDSVKNGIGGTEEAIIYASQELAKLGYKVFVFNDVPKGSRHSLPEANPRFLQSPHQHVFDIVLVCNNPNNIQHLKSRGKKIYLWPHTICYEKVNEKFIESFDDILWLSNYQRDQWISINPVCSKFTKIFGNGLQPDQFFSPKNRENRYSCIYASNYARGLSVLLNIWPKIKMKFPKASLDIYYGWQHWGTMSDGQERNLRHQVECLQALDVKEHGQVSHEKLSKAFSKASFWTYPCTYPETFCITAIKAQLAGAVPVIIEGSALKEMVRFGFKCDKKEDYEDLLSKAMHQAENISTQQIKEMGNFILENFTWWKITNQWRELFNY